MPLSKLQQEILEEFEKRFKCINAERLGCDSRGNIPVQVAEGEWEAEQCQYCFEVLFKHKSFLLSSIQQQKTETEKAFGGCKNCYGKGFATTLQFAAGHGTDERNGNISFFKKLSTMRFCSCERGKALRAEIENILQKQRDEIWDMMFMSLPPDAENLSTLTPDQALKVIRGLLEKLLGIKKLNKNDYAKK